MNKLTFANVQVVFFMITLTQRNKFNIGYVRFKVTIWIKIKTLKVAEYHFILVLISYVTYG